MTTQEIELLYVRIGGRLRDSRKKQHLTQEALAASLGYDRSSITNIEAGTQHAPLHTLIMLWQALGVNTSAIERLATPVAAQRGGREG